MSDLQREETEARRALQTALDKLVAFRDATQADCNACAINMARDQTAAATYTAALFRLGNLGTAIHRVTEGQMWFERKAGTR